MRSCQSQKYIILPGDAAGAANLALPSLLNWEGAERKPRKRKEKKWIFIKEAN